MEKNNQLAFDIAEKELGISPIMTGKEMASVGEPDKLSMVMYLTQFYEMFKDSLPSSGKGWQALVWKSSISCLLVPGLSFFPSHHILHRYLQKQTCSYLICWLSVGNLVGCAGKSLKLCSVIFSFSTSMFSAILSFPKSFSLNL